MQVDIRDLGSIPGLGRAHGGGQSTPVFLPEEPHGQDSGVHGVTESDITEVT